MLVLMNAIRATSQLMGQQPDHDFTELRLALEKLRDSNLPNAVKLEAKEVLESQATPAKAG